MKKKCLDYLSFEKSILIILIRYFSTNEYLSFISISSHWLGLYIFLVLELFFLVISFLLS